MADNTVLPGVGETYASDDIGGAKHQRVKISVGPDGSATDLSAAAPMPTLDPMLEIARGNVTGISGVNKFGRSTNVDSGVDTDIWDRANATDDQAIWVAPTTARTHQIVSTSTSDDGAPAGVGARTLRVFGLTAWDTAETNEDITLNGTTNVATANQYVIIHRMVVLTKGATNVNVGQITATADTDGTVTAQILAGQGQTQMAIYGLPSTQKAYTTRYYASVNSASPAAVKADISLLFNSEPDAELLNFLIKGTIGLNSAGAGIVQLAPRPYASFAGPGILKIQANASANDADVSAGFDLILVTN